ncbi:hypothetical protein BDP27DRAFT_1327961 [Rhodocollybia butyracea]|uniref:EamA domain-containing protein n=2 Tax=Rhodocollybia butyracea TaxID=206335 RepID=A0A9P5PLN3_9AGAR|nr:hypothetical protein BDP27DRAFT_1327961 [Rhodocollybia butyracea]
MDSNTSPARSNSTVRAVSSLSRTDLSHLGKTQYSIGVGLLLIVVFLWTASNFVTQDLFQDGYEKAFLQVVTYLNTSAFALYLLPSVLRLCLKRSFGRKAALPGYEQISDREDEDLSTDRRERESRVNEPGPSASSDLPPLTMQETAQLAFIFCFIWYVEVCCELDLNASLDYTSVASATILSSTSGFFTLGIGRIFKVETLTLAKIGAVSTSFVGVLLVALSDSSQSSSERNNLDMTPVSDSTRYALGDLLALFSAAFYAFYVILLKVRIRSESRIDMQLFFGFVGLFNIISCWPMGVILHFTGIEPFELPSTRKAIAALLINMAITWSSDYLYVIAMLKTTPLVVTIGLSLTIPLAVVGDFLLTKPVQAQVLVGALLVVGAFVVVGIDDAKTEPQDNTVDTSRSPLRSESRGRRQPPVEIGT